jgi:hypothetical protein
LNDLYSKCRSCGNITFTRNGHCVVCGHVKPEAGPDAPRVFDQRFMTRRQQRWRRFLVSAIVVGGVVVGLIFLALFLRAHL